MDHAIPENDPDRDVLERILEVAQDPLNAKLATLGQILNSILERLDWIEATLLVLGECPVCAAAAASTEDNSREVFEVAVALDQKIALQLVDEVERLTAENGRLRAEQRDAFEAGWEARGRAHGNWDGPATTIELAWEHFQAERMKAAATEETK